MERALRVLAERARRSLAERAEQTGVQYSFRVIRGRIPSELLASVSESDLLVLGTHGWGKQGSPFARSRGPGSTALQVATHARRVLLVRPSLPANKRVMVVHDGSQGATEALEVAARVADAVSSDLIILIPEGAQRSSKELEARATDLLSGQGIKLRYRALPRADVAGLAAAVRREGGGLLVLSGPVLQQEESIRQLLEEVEGALLLVR
ncbi:MAG TPA: universal stress protein [Blastocatellia bacterium]|nr:universal stress protein [Blastocatellia bacterium]